MPAANRKQDPALAGRYLARLLHDWRRAVKEPHVRRVLADILRQRDPLTPGRLDEFAQGERNLALYVHNRMLAADPRSVAEARLELAREPAGSELVGMPVEIVSPGA